MLRPPSASVAVLLALVVVASATTAGVAVATDIPAMSSTTPADVTDARTAQSTTPAAVDESLEANATVDAWRVPERADPANASVQSLREYAGDEEDVTNVTPHDRLVLDVDVAGLDATIANASGNASATENASANLTARVLAALDERGHFAVRQTDDTTPPERQSRNLWLNASNVRAVDAPGDDRYLLVVEPERVLAVHAGTFEDSSAVAEEHRDDDYRFDGVFEDGLAADEVYTARYFVNESVRGLAATSRRVRFRPAVATLDATGPLEPTANATVAGTTTVAPSTDLVVTARTDAGGVAAATATVDENGRYRATLDLASVDAPATLNLTVAPADDRSRTLTVEPATVAVREPRAVVAFDDQTTTTRYVTARANLSHGGHLELRHGGAVVDATTVLDAGARQTVTFSLPANATAGTYTVVVARGSASNPGQRYANGTANAAIAFETDTTTTASTTTTPTTTTPTTTTPATTTTPTTTAATTATDDASTTIVVDDPSPVPGFGVPVALAAVAALLGAVTWRCRREN